jgi:hypothetical protein
MQIRNNEFSALLIVLFVAFACIGAVSVIGGVINLLIGDPTPVACTVELISSDHSVHQIVGKGEVFL